MEAMVRICWGALALLHLAPAAVLLRPELAARLYDVDPAGTAGALIVHRGALFLAVLVAAVWALFDPGARRLASVVVAISMAGFLLVWWRAGSPEALRGIAIADMVGLVPLGVVLWAAWRG